MTDLLTEALARFDAAFQQAQEADPSVAPLMSLATADRAARPSVRIVRFTGLIQGSFTFFANRRSGKGHQLDENARAGLCFYWPNAEQQVVVDGSIEIMQDTVADDLWRTRPRPAALMAWASDQSREMGGPDELETRYRDATARFTDERVPRPPDWLAYGLRPERIEFWRGAWERRQSREAYLAAADGWRLAHLNP